MTHEQAVKALDQLINGLKRAEESRKDVDLLMTMRIVYLLLEDKVKSYPPKLPDFDSKENDE